MQNRYEALETSRSLTLLPGSIRNEGSAATTGTARAPRPDACFLTQLLAVKHDAPEYRLRRRTEPHLAMAAYGAQGLSVPQTARTAIAA